MKILYVQHDMLAWQSARQWTYTAHMAYVDGLRAQGHEVLVLLTSCWTWSRQIVGDHRFDQVWINDVIHSICTRPAWESPERLTAEDFAWLATLAPVRVGIVIETLHYEAHDYADIPELSSRVPLFQSTVVPHVTHFCVVDENDVRHVENMGVPGVWTPFHVPTRSFRAAKPRSDLPAAFIGSAYARRQKYAQNARLRTLLEFRQSGEYRGDLPAMFDQLNSGLRLSLLASGYRQSDYAKFVGAVHELRALLFDGFLDGLVDSMGSVNLPSFVKTYASRVIESMAIGQPVVSWRVPRRPRNARLFNENETVLFFDDDSPDQLADVLQRLRREPGLADRIGEQSRANALKHHTTEYRVGQILDWIDCRRTPEFWD